MTAPTQTPRRASSEAASVAGSAAPGRAAVRFAGLRRRLSGVGQRIGGPARRLRARIRSWMLPLLAGLRTFIAPIADRLRGPLSTFSGLGQAAAGAVVVLGVIGVWLGWLESIAIAVTLLLALLIAIGFILGRPSYEVTVNLATLRVVVGERASGELQIRGTSERSLPPALIELPVGRAVAAFPVPRLDPGQVHDELFMIPTQRRAVLTMGPVRSVRQDPLELLRRQLEWTEPEDIYVHPKTVRLDNSSTGFVRDLEGFATKDLANDDVSFHALREYAAGDDLRHVHWRSTARANKLMIRQFEETRRSQYVIVLSTRPADYTSDDEFELGISMAASLARSAHLDGKEVSVFTSDAHLPSPTLERLLDAFSGVEPSPTREGFGQRARVVAAEVPGASVVTLIIGGAAPIEELRLASIRIPVMARCVGLRAAQAEELGRSSIGDFVIATVPALEDLPRAARVVMA